MLMHHMVHLFIIPQKVPIPFMNSYIFVCQQVFEQYLKYQATYKSLKWNTHTYVPGPIRFLSPIPVNTAILSLIYLL